MKTNTVLLLIAALVAVIAIGSHHLADRLPRPADSTDQAYREVASLFDNRTYLSGW